MKQISSNKLIAVGGLGTGGSFSPMWSKYNIGSYPWIAQLDTSGNVIWERIINLRMLDGSPTIGILMSVTGSNDGGCVAVGYFITQAVPQGNRMFYMKFDKYGNIMWSYVHQNYVSVSKFYSVTRLKKGGYIATGTTRDFSSFSPDYSFENVFIMKFSEQGVFSWIKYYGTSTEFTSAGYSILEASDQSYVVAGQSFDFDSDSSFGFILKTDTSGALKWRQKTGGSGIFGFHSLIENPDKSFVCTGYAQNSNSISNDFGLGTGQHLWVLKADAKGNTIWSKNYGGSNPEAGTSIRRTIDNCYFVTGNTFSSDGTVSYNNGQSDIWLLKLKDDGTLIWEKTVGSQRSETSYASCVVNEYEFIIAGTADSMKGVSPDATSYLIKIGNSNFIKGNLFLDSNNNGTREEGEPLFSQAKVIARSSNSTYAAQSGNGNFLMDVDTGTYYTNVELLVPYYTVTPAGRTSVFSNYLNIDSFDFGIQPIPDKQDLIIDLLPISPARAGFNAQYVLNCRNIGTTTIKEGTVKLFKDNRSTYFNSIPLPSSILNDTIEWYYSNLKPFDAFTIRLDLKLAFPPVLRLADTLRFQAFISPYQGDQTPLDNSSELLQRVVGSFDPNDKQENLAGRISLKNVQGGSYINYVIRFQNTGTDTAFFVRVLDTLESKLDWSSFQMIGSSHAYSLTVKDGNKLNWFFDNIQLPDSGRNLQKSMGYIAYRIKPKPNLFVNDEIKNSASIYFDYNLPIKTNTTNTLVYSERVTGVRDINNLDMQIRIAPNPVAGSAVLLISGTHGGSFEFSVFDTQGRVLLNRKLTRGAGSEITSVPLELSRLSPGVYYLRLKQKNNIWNHKMVVQ